MNESQIANVRAYLLEGHSLTSMDAIRLFGATRLSAIIFKLKKEGLEIATHSITVPTRYGRDVRVAEYTIIGGNEDEKDNS